VRKRQKTKMDWKENQKTKNMLVGGKGYQKIKNGGRNIGKHKWTEKIENKNNKETTYR
jgi:hypothetical protein